MNRVVILAMFFAAAAGAQKVHRSPEIPKFMGREVVVYEPAVKTDGGIFPQGPARVCIEGSPQEQCYTAPEDFGGDPGVRAVELSKGRPALLFSARSWGVSGWNVLYALLVPQAKVLEDLFVDVARISNQSRVAFWSEPDLSDAKIFVTADAFHGLGEGNYGEHRDEISAYVLEGDVYWLADRYVTARWYDLEKTEVLTAERPEIVARLKKVMPTIRAITQ